MHRLVKRLIYEEAQNYFTFFPLFIPVSVLLWQVLTDKGDFEEADKYFDKAMKLDPSNATLMVHRGL